MIDQIEQMFAPDVRVRVGNNNRLVSVIAITRNGANFILKYQMLGCDYDTALAASNGLCFEQIE